MLPDSSLEIRRHLISARRKSVCDGLIGSWFAGVLTPDLRTGMNVGLSE